MSILTHENWITYCQDELKAVTPILTAHGYTLNKNQRHLKGERFLQQAVTTSSGKKLILLGTDRDNQKVVIKATSDKAGKKELTRERNCRKVLRNINFAGEIFHTPDEVDFFEEKNYLISIQRFIEQECSFLERPISEQFTLALAAFKAQESAHATTYKHRRLIKQTYNIRDSASYLRNFSIFKEKVLTVCTDITGLRQLLEMAGEILDKHAQTIEQYCGFLTHTDFVPHNFRIKNNIIYLLDHSSLTFGNKHESWARFLNFMILYNQPLEKAFVQYVRDNRSSEEQLSLKLMRIYRLGEILWYYTDKLPASSGNLLILNKARIKFWSEVLSCILENKGVPEIIITTYQTKRDSLRSEGEKERQKGLH